MARIFSVRLNLDDFFASVGTCDTDADRTAWLRGFQIGALGGASKPEWGEYKLAGYKVGNAAHVGVLEFRQKQSEKGKASAAARSTVVEARLNQASTVVEANVNQTSTISNNPIIEKSKEPKNETSNKPEASPSVPGISFDLFWNAYGKKVGKKEAETYWKSMKDAKRQAAIDGITSYLGTLSERRFQLDPIRYLRRERWEDEVLTITDIPRVPVLPEICYSDAKPARENISVPQ